MLSSSIHCTLWRSCSYLRGSCKRIREASRSRYIVLTRDVLQIWATWEAISSWLVKLWHRRTKQIHTWIWSKRWTLTCNSDLLSSHWPIYFNYRRLWLIWQILNLILRASLWIICSRYFIIVLFISLRWLWFCIRFIMLLLWLFFCFFLSFIFICLFKNLRQRVINSKDIISLLICTTLTISFISFFRTSCSSWVYYMCEIMSTSRISIRLIAWNVNPIGICSKRSDSSWIQIHVLIILSAPSLKENIRHVIDLPRNGETRGVSVLLLRFLVQPRLCTRCTQCQEHLFCHLVLYW